MGKSVSLRSMVVSKSSSTRTMNRKRLRAKSFGACRPESLERRMLLSAGAENREIHSSVLHGPVASAVTAAWYTQRVAALASLHSTLQASPTFQVQKQAGTSPQQSASPDPAGITPAQIESYYGFTGLSFGSTPADGRGQTIPTSVKISTVSIRPTD
jgi:hypothetical protein